LDMNNVVCILTRSRNHRPLRTSIPTFHVLDGAVRDHDNLGLKLGHQLPHPETSMMVSKRRMSQVRPKFNGTSVSQTRS
jgi:hypothetical protein